MTSILKLLRDNCWEITQNWHVFSKILSGPGQHRQYSDSLRAGRSEDRIPVEARFSASDHTDLGAHPASCTMCTGSLPGVKRRDVAMTTPTSSGEVKETVELYLYSPSGPSWSVPRQPLPLQVPKYVASWRRHVATWRQTSPVLSGETRQAQQAK
jgi:hypothetical protein